ncbi:MAG TPA: YihY/virulence factor BrkB family protein [Draconibacterium sp.]|nr:YihY/virulence factor BrkB family protein [Draconibacterium sp.]HRX10253.1 YihY/virulence factor BrkB family protein [Draconibacterium sp.]
MIKEGKYINHLIEIGENIAERAKKISLPFFEGVPVYDVALFFWRSIVDGAIATRASAIAFSFFVAFFPFIIFLFTLIPYIPIDNFQNELLILIQDLVPPTTYATIEQTVEDIITQPRGDLLSFGFLAALIFSTNGLAAMMSAFDATIHTIHRRSWISQRITAIYLLIILSVLLTIVIALLTSGQLIIQKLQDKQILHDQFIVFLLVFGKWMIILALLFFTFSFLYFMAPAKRIKWRFISAGGTLSTILSVFAFVGLSFYINRFNQYNKLYGSIGTLLIILLLMYVMSMILLIGFELNASIHQAKNESKELN